MMFKMSCRHVSLSITKINLISHLRYCICILARQVASIVLIVLSFTFKGLLLPCKQFPDWVEVVAVMFYYLRFSGTFQVFSSHISPLSKIITSTGSSFSPVQWNILPVGKNLASVKWLGFLPQTKQWPWFHYLSYL